IRRSGAPAAAQRRERSADVRTEQFVDQRQAVALVLAEGEERFDLGGIGGFVSVLVDAAAGGELLALANELLHASHGDRAGRPVDTDGEADRVLRGEAPRVRGGAERRELPAEGDDLR